MANQSGVYTATLRMAASEGAELKRAAHEQLVDVDYVDLHEQLVDDLDRRWAAARKWLADVAYDELLAWAELLKDGGETQLAAAMGADYAIANRVRRLALLAFDELLAGGFEEEAT